MGRLCLTANIIGLATIVFWALPLLLFASWRQCIEKSASVMWEMRGNFVEHPATNIIKDLKTDLKYKLQSQLNTQYLKYKARNQTVMFDANYLLQIRIERNAEQILLKTIQVHHLI